MRSLKLHSIVLVLALSLLAGGTAFADRSSGGGGYKGGKSGGGGYKGGYYRGGGYRGGGSKGGYYRSGGYHGGGRYYRGGHGHGYYRSGVDVVIGGPFWGAPWYYPYYYPYYPYYAPYYPYYPPAIEVPSSPQVYIERSKPGQSTPEPSGPSGVWFYCPDSKTYYPYVKECAGGWQTVPAEPPSGQGR